MQPLPPRPRPPLQPPPPPLNLFSQLVVNLLNAGQPNPPIWETDNPHMGNRQPWVRIFKRNWRQRWLPVGHADAERMYPVLWFEIKCHFNYERNEGTPPFDIFVPIDEHGLGFGDREFQPIPDQPGFFLPVPDTYRTILLTLSDCYQTNVTLWNYNVTNSINRYLAEHHFVGPNALPRERPREELDFGFVQAHHADDEDAQRCARFINKRTPTIDCLMNLG